MGVSLKGIFLSPEYPNTVTSGDALTTASGTFQSARIYADNYYGWYGKQSGTATLLTTKLRLPQDFQRLDRLTVRTGVGLTESGNNVSIYLYDKDMNLVPAVSATQFSTSGLVDSDIYFSGGNLVGGYPTTLVSRLCGASGVATLSGNQGTLRTYYFEDGIKRILNSNAGTVNYDEGVVTLTDFNPSAINNPLGILSVQAVPTSTIISSSRDKIITLDNTDPNAINVNIIAKV
jgi:hypothetical protein